VGRLDGQDVYADLAGDFSASTVALATAIPKDA
jgi:hypothetical protein